MLRKTPDKRASFRSVEEYGRKIEPFLIKVIKTKIKAEMVNVSRNNQGRRLAKLNKNRSKRGCNKTDKY